MMTSSSGTATPKIKPAGSLQASLASFRMILPNAARGAVLGSSAFESWAVDSCALESSAFGWGRVWVFMPGFLPRPGAVR